MYLRLILHAASLSLLCDSALSQPNRPYNMVAPALAVDFPDPSLVETEGAYYAFATSGNGKNIQIAASASFIEHSWSLMEGDALPYAGLWAENSNIWAPDVLQLEDGRWVMYYAAPVLGSEGTHCIGAAKSTNVVGPYEPIETPLACPQDQGGAIDPAGFLDPVSGNLYVVYKVDGNSINNDTGPCKGGGDPNNFHPTPIMVQQVSHSDGVTLIGVPFQILDRDDADGPLVEAPNLFYNEESGVYFLTFSSNCYATDFYDISFAYSSQLNAAFVKSKTPLMSTQLGPVTSPGGADMTADGKYAVFHGTFSNEPGEGLVRYMYAAGSSQTGCDMSAWPL